MAASNSAFLAAMALVRFSTFCTGDRGLRWCCATSTLSPYTGCSSFLSAASSSSSRAASFMPSRYISRSAVYLCSVMARTCADRGPWPEPRASISGPSMAFRASSGLSSFTASCLACCSASVAGTSCSTSATVSRFRKNLEKAGEAARRSANVLGPAPAALRTSAYAGATPSNLEASWLSTSFMGTSASSGEMSTFLAQYLR
mmetsp:Transcript_27388/g.74078  ORF Transcript_27388/g.74078 Transcript_27388/m.74078 type:complete len:202 (-) Transcript_27388:894-1499(-)